MKNYRSTKDNQKILSILLITVLFFSSIFNYVHASDMYNNSEPILSDYNTIGNDDIQSNLIGTVTGSAIVTEKPEDKNDISESQQTVVTGSAITLENPLITYDTNTDGNRIISISNDNSGDIYYSIDDNEYEPYNEPIELSGGVNIDIGHHTVNSYSMQGDFKSDVVSLNLSVIPNKTMSMNNRLNQLKQEGEDYNQAIVEGDKTEFNEIKSDLPNVLTMSLPLKKLSIGSTMVTTMATANHSNVYIVAKGTVQYYNSGTWEEDWTTVSVICAVTGLKIFDIQHVEYYDNSFYNGANTSVIDYASDGDPTTGTIRAGEIGLYHDAWDSLLDVIYTNVNDVYGTGYSAGNKYLNKVWKINFPDLMIDYNNAFNNWWSNKGSYFYIDNPSVSYNDYVISFSTCPYENYSGSGNIINSSITSISAKNTNQTIQYGDMIDPTIIITWSDGSTTEEQGLFTFNQPNLGTSTSVVAPVTVTYGGKSCTINATVTNYVTSIVSSSSSVNTYYGDTPSLYVNVTYADGSIANNQSSTVTSFNNSPSIGTSSSGVQVATISYQGMKSKIGSYLTTTTNVTVKNYIKSIAATKTTQSIYFGDSIDSTATVTYATNATANVTCTNNYNSLASFLGKQGSAIQNVTLTYQGMTDKNSNYLSATSNVTVKNYVKSLVPLSTTQDVYYGDIIDSMATVTYATDYTDTVTCQNNFNSTPSGLDNKASSNQSVTITYDGMKDKTGNNLSSTINVTVTNYVKSLVPLKTTQAVYYGDNIDTTATVTYATDYTEAVTCQSNFDSTPNGLDNKASAGQTVTLTYDSMKDKYGNNKSTSTDVTVNNYVKSLIPTKQNQIVYVGENMDTTATVTYATDYTETVTCQDNFDSTPSGLDNKESLNQIVTLIYDGMKDKNNNNISTSADVAVKNYVKTIVPTKQNQIVYYGDNIDTTATVTYATNYTETITCQSNYDATPVTLGTKESEVQNVTITFDGMTDSSGKYVSTNADVTVKNYVVSLIATKPIQNLIYGYLISELDATATVTYATNSVKTVDCIAENVFTNSGQSNITIKYMGMADKNGNFLEDNIDFTVGKKELSLSVMAKDKDYDGNDNADLEYSLNGIIGNDDVTIQVTGTYNQSNIGTNLPISLTYTLNGADKDNYFINMPTNITASINKKNLDVSVKGSKDYGTKNDSIKYQFIYNGFVNGENEDNLPLFKHPSVSINDSAFDVGEYTLTLKDGNSTQNYVYNYIDGVLKVTHGDNLIKTIINTPFKDVDVKVTIDDTVVKYLHTTVDGDITLWLTKGEHTIKVEYNGITFIIERTVVDDDGDGVDDNNQTNPTNPSNPPSGEQTKPTLLLDISNGELIFKDDVVIQNGISIVGDYIYKIIQSTDTTSNSITVSDNESIILDNVNIDNSSTNKASLKVNDGAIANITLVGDNKLISNSSNAGLQVTNGSTVIINGTNNDSLYAKGSSGIGNKPDEEVGTIIINGGRITAVGDSSGVGIGGNGATVEINDSVVSSIGGDGIKGDSIKITDSYVETTGTEHDGINGGTVEIINSTVISKGKENGISGDPITIKDSNVTAEGENGDGIHGGEVNIIGSDVTAKGKDDGIEGNPINITDSTVVAIGENGDGIHGGEVNIKDSDVTAKGGNNGIEGDPINIIDSKVDAEGKNGDGIHGGKVNIIGSDVIAKGGDDGIEGNPIHIEDSTVVAIGEKGDGLHGGEVIIIGSDVTAEGGNKGIEGEPIKIEDSHVISNGETIAVKDKDNPKPNSPSVGSNDNDYRTIQLKLQNLKKSDVVKYTFTDNWITIKPKDIINGTVQLDIPIVSNFIWIKQNEVLYFANLNNNNDGIIKTTLFKPLLIAELSSIDSFQVGYYLKQTSLYHEIVNNELNEWVTNSGTIKAKEGYLVSKDGEEWTDIIKLPSNRIIYDKYVFYVKNTKTKLEKQYSINNIIVDSNMPTNLVIKPTYSKYLATFYVQADFGLSGRGKIEYQFVKDNKKVNEKKWLECKTNTITKNSKTKFIGTLYVKFTDMAGNVYIKSKKVYCSDIVKPAVSGVKNNGIYSTKRKISFKDSFSGIKNASLNGKEVKNNIIVSKPGIYILKVYDKAGNVKKVKFSIRY